jgi:hypothetical protein
MAFCLLYPGEAPTAGGMGGGAVLRVAITACALAAVACAGDLRTSRGAGCMMNRGNHEAHNQVCVVALVDAREVGVRLIDRIACRRA